jgi:glycosyltransferase involved in cell wall biosynthesis
LSLPAGPPRQAGFSEGRRPEPRGAVFTKTLMKILIIKPILPYPPTQGTRRVTLNLIRALQGPHEVTLLCKTLTDSEEGLVSELATNCRSVLAIRAPNTRSFAHRVFFKLYYCLKTLFTLTPLRQQYDCPGEIIKAARALTDADDYDVLLVEYWTMAATAPRSRARVKVLLEHDVDYLRNRERYLAARGFLSRATRYLAWKLEERGQTRAYPHFDAILTLTDFDRAQIQELLSGMGVRSSKAQGTFPVRVLPTGVDSSFFEAPGRPQEENSILFVGSFAADFNVDAIKYFVEKVFPHILEAVPQARLYVAGGDAPPRVEALGREEGVTFLGLQKDLTGPLASASVFVVPLRFAGGLRIRTLEAMAIGKAIVTTSVGIRGIDAVNGRDLLIADGDTEFASAVVSLLKDAGRRAQLGDSARRFAMGNYSIDAAGRRATRIFEQLSGGA